MFNILNGGKHAVDSTDFQEFMIAPLGAPIVQTTPVQAELATLVKLRSPESAEARTKLRRTAESQKADIELKPCQTLSDYQLSFK